MTISPDATSRQIERLNKVRADRDSARVARSLDALEAGACGDANLMPMILDAVQAYASVGEICDRLRKAFGEYEDSMT